MAEHKSAKKRHKQSARANVKNRAIKTAIKTKTKALIATAGKPESTKSLPELASLLDKAVNQKVLHKRAAARKKSRLAKLLNKKAAAK